MATTCDQKDLDKIERVIARARCHALGLNEHFPRAVLYGPMQLGGLEIPSIHVNTMCTRINYFLYHTRLSTKVGRKLEVSMAYIRQLLGLCTQVLSCSYETYGFLITNTLIKCIWAETEPFGITLRSHKNSSWVPQLQGAQDIAIMEIATKNYNNHNCTIINRCRLYLKVLTLYDLLQYDGSIHPNIKSGKRVETRISNYFWVEFKRPPKKYFKLWSEFITTHIEPRLHNMGIKWDTQKTATYHITSYYSPSDNCIYIQGKDRQYNKHTA